MSEYQKMNLNLPILMYHGVVDDFQSNPEIGNSPYYITTSQFEAQMRYLYENGYRTLPLSQLRDFLHKVCTCDEQVRDKFIIITFDDGYQNNYFHALPVLKKYSFAANFFVIVSRIGTNNYLNWEQLKQMTDEGMEIHSHTLNHLPLETLSFADVEKELHLSKEILEQRLNRTVAFISYPHGSYNKKIIEVARKAGYIGGCTSEIAFFNSNSDPFEIGRLDIRREYDTEDFIKLIQKDSSLIKKIKCSKMIKRMIRSSIGIKNYNRMYKKVRQIHRLQD